MNRNKLLLVKSVILMSVMILGMGSQVSALTVSTVEDLNQDGIIVALQSGTTSDLYAQDNLKKATIKAFDSFDKVIDALKNEDAHFALGDTAVLEDSATSNTGFKVIDTFSPEEFGIAVRKDSGELLDALNAALTKIIDSGEYDTIYKNWFKGDVILTDDSDADTAKTFPTPTSGSTLQAVIDAGKLVFGSDTTYPPFESLDKDGKVVGFDAEIADAIATQFSTAFNTTINATMFSTAWDPIIPDLKASKFDAILSAMTKTEERAQQVDFTRAYYTSTQGVLQGPKPLPTEEDAPLPVIPVFLSVFFLALVIRRTRKH